MMRLNIAVGFCLAAACTGAAQEHALYRAPEQRIDLSEHIGKTYLQTFLTPIVGIDAELDADIYRPVEIVQGSKMVDMLDILQPDVAARLYRDFAEREAGFLRAIAAFEGKEVVPGELRELMRPVTAPLATSEGIAGRTNGATTGLALLLSGSGTLVIMDDENYFYNVGYQDDNVTTGRSYAASGERPLLDPTHRDYLRILHEFLIAGTEDTAFYRTMMEILTATDVRGIAGLGANGQVVMTDFLSVYTAELERHEMVGLGRRSPWGIDYAEVTLVADFGAASGMAMRNGAFVTATSEAYADKGSIGNVRGEFGRLSKLITAYLREPGRAPRLVDRLVDLTPILDSALLDEVGDNIFRRVLTYLNMRSTIDAAQVDAVAITDGMVELMDYVRNDQAGVTAFVQSCMGDPAQSFSCRAADTDTVQP